jgi:hypothetical protein
MADTFTTTLSLTKPEVGASADTWGTKLNDNLDDIDALFSAGPVLKVANGGTAATTASGARTSLGLGTMATQDASAVAVSGGTFTGVSYVNMVGTEPHVRFYESDATATERGWELGASGDSIYFGAYADDFGSGNTFLAVNRTGTTVDSIALTATSVTINGNAAFHAGTFTAPDSGSFTVSLRAVSDVGTVLGTGTAYWRKFNNTVTLRLPSIFPSSTATSLWLTGIPADIQAGALGGGAQYIPLTVVNGGTASPGYALVTDSASAWNLAASSAWSATDSAKGVAHTCMTYQIAN